MICSGNIYIFIINILKIFSKERILRNVSPGFYFRQLMSTFCCECVESVKIHAPHRPICMCQSVSVVGLEDGIFICHSYINQHLDKETQE